MPLFADLLVALLLELFLASLLVGFLAAPPRANLLLARLSLRISSLPCCSCSSVCESPPCSAFDAPPRCRPQRPSTTSHLWVGPPPIALGSRVVEERPHNAARTATLADPRTTRSTRPDASPLTKISTCAGPIKLEERPNERFGDALREHRPANHAARGNAAAMSNRTAAGSASSMWRYTCNERTLDLGDIRRKVVPQREPALRGVDNYLGISLHQVRRHHDGIVRQLASAEGPQVSRRGVVPVVAHPCRHLGNDKTAIAKAGGTPAQDKAARELCLDDGVPCAHPRGIGDSSGPGALRGQRVNASRKSSSVVASARTMSVASTVLRNRCKASWQR